jgi:hypothetical protein
LGSDLIRKSNTSFALFSPVVCCLFLGFNQKIFIAQVALLAVYTEDELRKRKDESLKTLSLSELKEIRKNNDKDVLMRDDLGEKQQAKI